MVPVKASTACSKPSKVNSLKALVPTMALTVALMTGGLRVARMLPKHAMVVAEDHDVVLQAASAIAIPVGVRPCKPKFSPEIVTGTPLVVAPFIER